MPRPGVVFHVKLFANHCPVVVVIGQIWSIFAVIIASMGIARLFACNIKLCADICSVYPI